MNDRLDRSEVAVHVAALRTLLTKVQASRLDAIIEILGEDGRFRLRDALRAGEFPASDARGQDAFQDFRKSVNATAIEAGVGLALELDTRKATPDERYGWFAGGSLVDEGIAAFTGSAAARTGIRHPVTASVAELGASRRTRVYVSHGPSAQAKRLLEMLRHDLAVDPACTWEIVGPDDVGIGESQDEVRDRWCAQADVRVALLTPSYLVDRSERARVLEAPGRVVAFALSGLPDGELDLGPLRRWEIGQRDRPWDVLTRPDQRRRYVQRLVDEIRKALDRDGPTRVVDDPPEEAFAEHAAVLAARRRPTDSTALVVGYSGPTSLAESLLDRSGPASGPPLPAVDRLVDWAVDRRAGAPRLAALLGDVGMGKTTTAKLFTRRLLERRRADPRAPLPILFDLRDVRTTDLAAKLSLDHILAGMLDNTRAATATIDVTATAVRRRIARGDAVVVFDGLDEVLVHLAPADQRLFTAQLFRAVDEESGSRMLLTCRTQYFRTLRDEVGFFSGHGREGLRGEDYLALVMLPFRTKQVREYLAANLGWNNEQVDGFLAVIADVHDLSDLASRPVTLRMIADQVDAIERSKLAGGTVRAVDLYGEFVDRWLERDEGKHSLRPDHKRLLMEHAAAALWRAGRTSWDPGDLDDWLLEILDARPDIQRRYAGWQPDLWTADFRTATFLSREGDGFSFAHRSLFEYFLARYLCRALSAPDSVTEAWALPVPSPETLGFLGQSVAALDAAPQATAIAALTGIGRRYITRTSELALAYALHAQQHGYPHQPLAGVVLRGAQLAGWRFGGDPPGATDSPEDTLAPRLSLAGADLSSADLRGTVFDHVDLSGADLSRTDLTAAEFYGSWLTAARVDGARATGTILRRSRISRLALATTIAFQAQVLSCAPPPGQVPGWLTAPRPSTGRAPISGHLRVLTGHSGVVLSVAYSPDGTHLATAGDDGSVRIWDSTGYPVHLLTGHPGGVYAVAYSPDGTQLATAGADGSVRIWDTTTGHPRHYITGHTGVARAVAYSHNGTHLATAGDDSWVRIWDTTTGRPRHHITGHTGVVRAVAYSHDSTHLATAGADGSVRIWDTTTGQAVHQLTGHTGWVQAVAYSSNGTYLATTGDDGSVRIWDTTTGQPVHHITGHPAGVYAVAYSPDGTHLATAGDDSSVRIWDTTTGQPRHNLTGLTGWFYSVAYSPDGTHLATAGDDGPVRIWDTTTGHPLHQLTGRTGGVLAVAFSPDGTHLATAGDDGSVRSWDTTTGRPVHHLTGHTDRVHAVAYSPDGTHLATAGDDSSVRIWDTTTGHPRYQLTGHTGGVYAVAYSPDGTRLATAGHDESVRIWDTTGRPCHHLTGHPGAVLAVAYSPAGTHLATAGTDSSVRIWALTTTGQLLHHITGLPGGIYAVAYSPDGTHLATAGHDGSVRFWNTTTGQPLHHLTGHTGGIYALAYSPDGTHLATAGNSSSVRIWNSTTGQPLHQLAGHTGWVTAVAYHPDGTHLATAGSDGSVRIWDTTTGEPSGPRVHLLPDGEVAVFDATTDVLTGASAGAWRWLGWTVVEDGRLTRLPAETFGELPALCELARPRAR